ncbi:hypothetical protein BJY22_004829 [Kribbella shirazensis]|uniref:Uncharacterized protein n=1 Tax=Kribbella shirazensis TaxID=1105143 RepID=A0A7X5VDE0_9ACTN|nr:hypothetical protein [Kribbella shirazensis]
MAVFPGRISPHKFAEYTAVRNSKRGSSQLMV